MFEKYSEYTRDEILKLNYYDLLDYVNTMLANGYTMNKIDQEKSVRRNTIRDRLKKIGYKHDSEVNRYVKFVEVGETDDVSTIKASQERTGEEKRVKTTNKSSELEKRLEALEVALSELQGTGRKTTKKELEVINFIGKSQNKNYPIYQEVTTELDKYRQTFPHLKVKDVINTVLFNGLKDLNEFKDNEEE